MIRPDTHKRIMLLKYQANVKSVDKLLTLLLNDKESLNKIKNK